MGGRTSYSVHGSQRICHEKTKNTKGCAKLLAYQAAESSAPSTPGSSGTGALLRHIPSHSGALTRRFLAHGCTSAAQIHL